MKKLIASIFLLPLMLVADPNSIKSIGGTASNLTITSLAANENFNNFRGTNVADPVGAQDIATKHSSDATVAAATNTLDGSAINRGTISLARIPRAMDNTNGYALNPSFGLIAGNTHYDVHFSNGDPVYGLWVPNGGGAGIDWGTGSLTLVWGTNSDGDWLRGMQINGSEASFQNFITHVYPLRLSYSDGSATFGGLITGNGGGLTNLNASELLSGTIPGARLSLSSGDIPNLDASKITSGTFPTNREPLDHGFATNLNASELRSGTVPAARMPAFSGDVTSSSGSTTLTLGPSGVTAGSYTSADITVGVDGRITSISNGSGGSGIDGITTGAVTWGDQQNYFESTDGYQFGGATGVDGSNTPLGSNILAKTVFTTRVAFPDGMSIIDEGISAAVHVVSPLAGEQLVVGVQSFQSAEGVRTAGDNVLVFGDTLTHDDPTSGGNINFMVRNGTAYVHQIEFMDDSTTQSTAAPTTITTGSNLEDITSDIESTVSASWWTNQSANMVMLYITATQDDIGIESQFSVIKKRQSGETLALPWNGGVYLLPSTGGSNFRLPVNFLIGPGDSITITNVLNCADFFTQKEELVLTQ